MVSLGRSAMANVNRAVLLTALMIFYLGTIHPEETNIYSCATKISEAQNKCDQSAVTDKFSSVPEEKAKQCRALQDLINCLEHSLVVECTEKDQQDLTKSVTAAINSQIEKLRQSYMKECQLQNGLTVDVYCLENASKAIEKCRTVLDEYHAAIKSKDEVKFCSSVKEVIACTENAKTEAMKCKNKVAIPIDDIIKQAQDDMINFKCEKKENSQNSENGKNNSASPNCHSNIFIFIIFVHVLLILRVYQ